MKRAILLAAGLLMASTAMAVDVRGRIDYFVPQGIFPMSRATVQLCMLGGGCLPPYVTGDDGMYYFSAAPGMHDVLVNGRPVFRIMIPNSGRFDIQPLRGN